MYLLCSVRRFCFVLFVLFVCLSLSLSFFLFLSINNHNYIYHMTISLVMSTVAPRLFGSLVLRTSVRFTTTLCHTHQRRVGVERLHLHVVSFSQTTTNQCYCQSLAVRPVCPVALGYPLPPPVNWSPCPRTKDVGCGLGCKVSETRKNRRNDSCLSRNEPLPTIPLHNIEMLATNTMC